MTKEIKITTPARILFDNLLKPNLPSHPQIESTDPCWLCGYEYDGVMFAVNKAIGANFTDHANTSCPNSDVICAPCCWALSGRPPDTLRAWSIVWRPDRKEKISHEKAPKNRMAKWTHYTARNDVTEIIDILIDPPSNFPWICCIAYTGQIHALPFSTINFGKNNWNVRADRKDIQSSPDKFGRLMYVASRLYMSGFNREEIFTGQVHPSKLYRFGIKLWRQYDAELRSLRGGNTLELATFLLTKKGLDYVIGRTERFELPSDCFEFDLGDAG